ncbi:MAG: hypothetical protein FJ144_14615 [Deltaproteobacteria bacterium]|nr:hypothetical protein [Deltaproteobacteria bacterium]
MRRDVPELSRSHEALVLWQRLDATYDEIARALEGAIDRDLTELLGRVSVLEQQLAPLVREIAALRARHEETDPALAAVWCEIDALVASLVDRQPTLVRAAVAARARIAEKLVELNTAKAQLHGYGVHGGRPTAFATRYA